MQSFKVGDWVRDLRNNRVFQINSTNFNLKLSIKNSVYKHWQPAKGELFWGTRELHSDYQYEIRTELFQVNNIHSDGTLSLVSPLDKNVYSLWIQPKDLQDFMKTAEPFIGELPSFLKDNT